MEWKIITFGLLRICEASVVNTTFKYDYKHSNHNAIRISILYRITGHWNEATVVSRASGSCSFTVAGGKTFRVGLMSPCLRVNL